MTMDSSNATIDDFSDWIDWHLDKASSKALKAVTNVKSKASLAGSYQSGSTIILTFEAVHEEFEKGLDVALGELKRASRITNLDQILLRTTTKERLKKFITDMKTATGSEQLREFAGTANTKIDEWLSDFDKKLTFALRQFDVGFLDPLEPEVPLSMNNNINIGVMAGGAVQQGSPDATQNVSTEINMEGIQPALKSYEDALAEVVIPNTKLSEITADLDTIKAQLGKPSPSQVIVREAGQSLRNITEGIIASGTAQQLVAVAPALWKVLGLG